MVLGGGYVGLYTSLGLLRKLRAGEATVTVIDPRSYMVYDASEVGLPEDLAGQLGDLRRALA